MDISMIERHGSWYDIYDERGEKQKTVPESIGMMLGWSTHFFIVQKGSWYDLYDEQGKKYKTIPESIGSFMNITGDTFVIPQIRSESVCSNQFNCYACVRHQ